MRNRVLLLLSALLLTLPAACGGGSGGAELPPPPTQAATAVVEVTESAAASSPSPQPAAVATLPPPPTVAPAVTNTPAALPTPEVTPESSAVLLLNPEDFAGRNPITGEPVDDPTVLERRPIAVKLSNAPADYTRPQAGLNDADMLFEHWTEGAVTRFTALFYDTIPPNVGPVRSARLIDVEIPAMYDAMLAFSGASVGVNQRLNASDFRDRLLRAAEPGFYRTGDETKPFEHTLYIRLADLWQAVASKGLNTPPRFGKINAFSSEPPPGGAPASKINLDYRTEKVEWVWDEEIGRYRRWMDFEEHVDANTSEQVTAANVIVISPFHVNDPTICEQVAQDGTCAALSVEIQLWGTGSGAVFRDGQRYDVTWRREGRNDMLTFTDAQGNPFPLQIGNSWVQVVPSFLREPLTVEP